MLFGTSQKLKTATTKLYTTILIDLDTLETTVASCRLFQPEWWVTLKTMPQNALSEKENKYILKTIPRQFYKREKEREKEVCVSINEDWLCIIKFSHGLHNKYLQLWFSCIHTCSFLARVSQHLKHQFCSRHHPKHREIQHWRNMVLRFATEHRLLGQINRKINKFETVR